MVGRKVAIVSDKPQTTRRAIRGVATRGDAQLVLVDLPGVQRPRDALTERMQRRVESRARRDRRRAACRSTASRASGPGDRFIADALRGAGVPVVVAVNKVDRLDRPHTLAGAPGGGRARASATTIFPVSARTGRRRRGAARPPARARARGPVPLPAPRSAPTSRDDVLLAELVREQVLRRTFQEVPHAVEVVIEELEQPRRRPHGRARARLGRDRVAEGHPDRRRRADDQGDRHGRAARARARARHARAPRPLGPRAARLARRRALLDRLGIE